MNYTFHAYKELATSDGFNYPVDVKYGNTYIGTLEVKPHGVAIMMVDRPIGKIIIPLHPKLTFKTQEIAAKNLHHLWKVYRSRSSSV